MFGFLLDEKGDIVIENGSIATVSDNELTAQTLRTIMGTNKGEWFMDEEEGIRFSYLLGKGITDDMRLAQAKDACRQVDESLYVTEFKVEVDKETRGSRMTFKAQNDNETVVTYNETFGDETNDNAASKLAQANTELAGYRSAVNKLERRLDGENV